jgi:hypothetical protein
LNDDPVPKPWDDKWSMKFTEKRYFPLLGKKTTEGTWYYNYSTKSFRIDRDDGSRNHYCGTIFPLSKTECRMIVNDGWR